MEKKSKKISQNVYRVLHILSDYVKSECPQATEFQREKHIQDYLDLIIEEIKLWKNTEKKDA